MLVVDASAASPHCKPGRYPIGADSACGLCQVKLVIDDNNVTIAGHPKDYFPGYDVEKTLAGHGMVRRPQPCALAPDPRRRAACSSQTRPRMPMRGDDGACPGC